MTSLGQKASINGNEIYYEKRGSGDIPILLVPGGTGSIRTDTIDLFQAMSTSKYTIIAMDPAGYGRSRPPVRDYTKGIDLYKGDAETGIALMAHLGFSSFCWVGWSDGGRAGLVAASSFPARIDKLVVWGAAAVVTPRQKTALETSRDISYWEAFRRDRFIEEYGTYDAAQDMWSRHVNYYKTIGDICRSNLKDIRCPVLVLHGSRDPVEVDKVKEIVNEVGDSQYIEFPDAGHDVHISCLEKFVQKVEKFLDDYM